MFAMALKYFRLLLLTLAIAAGPAAGADSPLWFAAGRPTAQARQALESVGSPDTRGDFWTRMAGMVGRGYTSPRSSAGRGPASKS